MGVHPSSGYSHPPSFPLLTSIPFLRNNLLINNYHCVCFIQWPWPVIIYTTFSRFLLYVRRRSWASCEEGSCRTILLVLLTRNFSPPCSVLLSSKILWTDLQHTLRFHRTAQVPWRQWSLEPNFSALKAVIAAWLSEWENNALLPTLLLCGWRSGFCYVVD